MKSLVSSSKVLIATAALFAGAPSIHASPIIFDQGPGTGAGGWSNVTTSQNFADEAQFATAVTVTGYNYFSTFNLNSHSGASDFHFKILADAGGTPGAVLWSEDVGYTSAYTEAGFNAYHFDVTPQALLSGTTYWFGLSGNGFEAAQLALSGVAGGDGHMAQFSGGSYFFMTAVGDQAFQLTGEGGTSVPDSAGTSILVGLSVLALAGIRRRSR